MIPQREFEFLSSDQLVDYAYAIDFMEKNVALIHQKSQAETIWFLEHPALYTAGTSANEADLIDKSRFPVYQTGRGGQYTYHGPGQLVCYIMLNIQARKIGVREYVQFLEGLIIDTLAEFGIYGEIRSGRVGVWVCDGAQEAKIAAIGVRVRRGVTYHGIAINIDPDLSAFGGIIPCGIQEHGVTSFAQLDKPILRQSLQDKLKEIFLLKINNITMNIV